MANKKHHRPTVLQLDIVQAWADGLSTQEIAKKCGCSVDNVYKTKALKHLKYMYFEKQQQAVQELVPLAIKRLANILKDEKTPTNNQLSAIREVLDRSHINELLAVENAQPIEHDVSVKIEYV